MFEDLLEEPDLLDCMVETHVLKEDAKKMDDKTLVEYVVEYTKAITVTERTELAVSRYFNLGQLGSEDRDILENFYVIKRCILCWCDNDDESGVYHVVFKSDI